jgi:hypothetical protein
MRDQIGNRITEKDLVRWNIPEDLLHKLVFNVVRVSDGGIATPQGNTPPLIQLSITIPIHSDTPEPVLTDFVCVRNPESEALLDALAGVGGRKQ